MWYIIASRCNWKLRDKCIKIYELHPGHFLSALGLAWKACLKKEEVNLELLTDIDKLLIVEEGIRGKICQEIHKYAKANNKYMNHNIIFHAFRCKQFVWMGDDLKTSCKWF